MLLLVGNKNYSSWSMRAWVLLRQAGIAFDEVALSFNDENFHARVAAVSPAGRVPVLVDDEGLAVWDSLAIAETLAERHPELGLWPRDARQRARARSLCAEMHSGFGALRSHFPMNIEAALPEVGARVLHEQAAAAADLARLDTMWSQQLRVSGGPLLFGGFTIADAFFAPVAMRIRSYALPVSPASQAYVERLAALPAVQDWIAAALAEHDFVAEDEPYRSAGSPA